MKDHQEPITEKPFRTDRIVICGKCEGRKTIILQGKTFECPVCRGSGLLQRITEGIVKLYLTH